MPFSVRKPGFESPYYVAVSGVSDEGSDAAHTTRGTRFRALIRRPRALLFVGAIALAAGAAGALEGIVLAALAAIGAALVALFAVWLVADVHSEEDFLADYGEERALARGSSALLPAFPTMMGQSGGSAKASFAGVLPGGVKGLLAHYVIEFRGTGTGSASQTQQFPYTIAVAAVPESEGLFEQFVCQPRVGARFLDSVEDVFRDRQRVEVESQLVDQRWEIFIGGHDDPNRARQLLSPAFLDWLASLDDDLGFKLERGFVVCIVPGHLATNSALDRLSESASELTAQIAKEARESPSPALPDRPAGEDSAADFDPRASLLPLEPGRASREVQMRMFALAGLVGTVIILVVALFAIPSEDDGGGGRRTRARPKHREISPLTTRICFRSSPSRATLG